MVSPLFSSISGYNANVNALTFYGVKQVAERISAQKGRSPQVEHSTLERMLKADPPDRGIVVPGPGPEPAEPVVPETGRVVPGPGPEPAQKVPPNIGSLARYHQFGLARAERQQAVAIRV